MKSEAVTSNAAIRLLEEMDLQIRDVCTCQPHEVETQWQAVASPRGGPVLKTVEATVDTGGHVHLNESICLLMPRRALVTILDEAPLHDVPMDVNPGETALLSEAALAVDWNTPEEDEAWRHLDSLPDIRHPPGAGD